MDTILINRNIGLGNSKPKHCGYICRKLRGIGGVARRLGLKKFADKMEEWSESDVVGAVDDVLDIFLRKMSDYVNYEPTPEENAILDPWNLQFEKFFEQTFLELNAGLKAQDFRSQLIAINTALMRMCIVYSYYSENETRGLSIEAIQARNVFMTLVFEEIHTIIKDVLQSKIYTSQTVSSTPDSVIIKNFPNIKGAYTCTTYTVRKGELDDNPIPQEVINNVINEPVKGTISVGNTNNTIVTTTTTTDIEPKSNTGLIIGSTLSVFGLWLLLSKEDKKNKTKNN